MELSQLAQRAKEIRALYSQFEKKRTGKSWTNLNIMEGFVGDIGALMKVVMAKEGLRDMNDIDQKLQHQLSDCLWCLLVLANNYDIDLEKYFFKTMNELESMIKQEL